MLTDRIICAVMLVLAAVYFYATAQIPALEIGDPLGPKAFPVLLGIALIVAVILLFFETLKAGADAAPRRAHAWREDRRHLLLIGGVTLWTVAYFWVFDRAGFIVATTLYLFVLMAVFNRGKWVSNALTASLFTLGTYVLFVKILHVSLPGGILGF